MVRCGEATLGKTIALLVSSRTKIPGVEVGVPMLTLAVSKSSKLFCSVRPSTLVIGSTVVPVASTDKSFHPEAYFTYTFLSEVLYTKVPFTASVTAEVLVTHGKMIPLALSAPS